MDFNFNIVNSKNMKCLNINNQLLVLGLIALGLSACVKPNKPEPMGDAGQTLVKILGGGEDPVVLPLDVNPPVEKIQIADLRKDPANSTDLNTATTVTITNTQAFLDAYNTANHTSYELLPTSAYTITAESGVSVNGNTWTINLAPGEFARSISINLDKTKMDLSKQYAFGLQITQTSVGKASLGSGFGIVNVIVKNKYDGIYSVVSGLVTRYTSPGVPAGDALSGSLAGNPDVSMATLGANTVEITGLQWANSGGGVGGIANLRATVDPLTNLVTMSALGSATLGNWAGHENKYDPATKTFYLAFRWNPATTTREYEIVLKYKGPR